MGYRKVCPKCGKRFNAQWQNEQTDVCQACYYWRTKPSRKRKEGLVEEKR